MIDHVTPLLLSVIVTLVPKGTYLMCFALIAEKFS
jgi:hypothetical protein